MGFLEPLYQNSSQEGVLGPPICSHVRQMLWITWESTRENKVTTSGVKSQAN